jgi:CheY-like chemotaxis protein
MTDFGRDGTAAGPRGAGAVAARAVRVLCVDDEPAAADTLAALLGLAGYEVRTCYDGPAALAAAADFRPHACVLDINMPLIDGFDVARWLRTSMGRAVRLVALTGDARPDLDRRAADAGFDHIFIKPADPDELARALKPAADQDGE